MPVGATSVLIVGDPALSRSLMRLVLDRLDYAVCCVATAREARETVRLRSFSYALVAAQLPDGCGLALARELRDLVPGLQAAVFGEAEEEELAPRCREAGLQAYLKKPISFPRLLALLRRAGPPRGGLPPIDPARLDEVSGGDRALAAELLALFQDSAERYLARIAAAADEEEARRIAHALKGASRNIGAPIMAALAERMEREGVRAELLQAAQEECARIRKLDIDTLLSAAGSRARAL